MKDLNPIRTSQIAQFIELVRTVLIPDYKAAGYIGHVSDLKTFLKYVDGQGRTKDFGDKYDFSVYLLKTLIPDLKNEGLEATAETFQQCADVLTGYFKATYPAEMQRWIDQGFNEEVAAKLFKCQYQKENIPPYSQSYVLENTVALTEKKTCLVQSGRELMTRFDPEVHIDHEGADMLNFHHPMLGCLQFRIYPDGVVKVIGAREVTTGQFGHPED